MSEDSFYRLKQIVGDKKNEIPPIIPVSPSTWWLGVKSGRYPKPIKLSQKVTVWRGSDLLALIQKEVG
ncbi:transcriptional regulator [Gammaproteobacteria bacterium]|nr:transcriptional regulator [Gammaproteobacteria bacterium]